MVFKSKLFSSLKKSRSSNSSNNPQSGGSNSPIGSDEKKSKSESKEETRSLSFTLGLKKRKKDDSSKGKVASSSNLSYSGHETLPPTSEVKEKPRSLASFLGLNRIKTRFNSFNLGNNNAIGTSLDSSSGSGSGDAKKEEGSSSVPLPVSETGQFKEVSPSCSGPAGSSEVCIPEDLYELENRNEPESIRCQTLPCMTSAPIACSHDIKSFSHEFNSKGVRTFPLWKPHGLHSLEEILNMIRTKFDKEKEEVNSELAAFAWELVGYLESHRELQVQIEDLLLLARKCAETPPGEFWRQCEDIVQDLDNRRQELSSGVLKQLHSRMLFILTRCTRLLLQKESWEYEVVQSRDLHFADNRVPTGEARDGRVCKRFPFPASKGVKESAVSKEQNDSKVERPKVVKHRAATAAKPPKCPAKLSHGHMSKHHHNISEEWSIICRICEEEICISYVEDHSRICASAEKHDQKGVSVDERLLAVAVTLKKIIEKFMQKESLAAVESSNGMQISNASLTKEYDVLSPKLSDWSRKGSEDMLDCFLEADNSDSMDNIGCLTLMSCMTCFGLKSDQGMTTSSASSITPGGRGAFYEQDDIPQMSKLADIAIRAANVIPDGDHFTQLLLACLRDLKVVINHRKFDALIVETFGTRIEKFIWEKYLRLCNILGDEKVDLSSIDEDAPLEDDVVRSLRTSQVHPRNRISIDDFEILNNISSGAYGKVLLAKKRITGDIFAIKVLKKADIIRKNAVKSILAERDILINARNPYMVRFFYSFTSPKKVYLVMEYLNGGDFYSLLKKFGSLDESIARVYIAEIVLALEYLHSKDVVHHDLKPDNLLIARDGHVKLTDFGLSKVGHIDSTNDLSGPVLRETSEHQLESVMGTPDYLAPEIFSGTGQGATVDWWSVGIILFELIAGRPPFNADNPQQIFENIRNRNIPWPRVPEEMSPEARDLIDRLLTEDPQQRLGARGAAEVKQHIFFKDINWDTLAEQEPAFLPDSTNACDTSYFESRYSSDSKFSSDCDSLSDRQNEGVDEFDEFAEFKMYEDYYSFSTFSLKNLFELAYLTREALAKFYIRNPRPRSYRRRQRK